MNDMDLDFRRTVFIMKKLSSIFAVLCLSLFGTSVFAGGSAVLCLSLWGNLVVPTAGATVAGEELTYLPTKSSKRS